MSKQVREIRIHGVSGTPPQAMLSRDGAGDPDRVASYVDRLTGFYRGQGEAAPGTIEVEAYSWGALTSGGARLQERVKRIGWLALLPFALVNVAYWSRPGIDREDAGSGGAAPRGVTAVAVRWAGLLLTMAFIGTACLVCIDLVAWQCFRGGGRVCSLPDRIPFLGLVDFLATPTWNSPSRRLLAASIVPVAVILLLRWLGGQSRGRYEAVPDAAVGESADPPGPGVDGDAVILRRAKMWQGQDRIKRQQRLHLVAGSCVVILYVALPLLESGSETAAPGVQGGIIVLRIASALALLAMLAAFLSAALSVHDGNDFAGISPAKSTRAADLSSWFGVIAVLLASGFVLWANWWLLDGLAVDEGHDLFGHNLFIGVVFGLLAAIVTFLIFAARSLAGAVVAVVVFAAVVLVALGLGQAASPSVDPAVATGCACLLIAFVVGAGSMIHSRTSTKRQSWGGAAPAVVLGGAMWLALMFTVVTAVGAADLLNGQEPVTTIQSNYDAEQSVAQVVLDHQGSPAAEWSLSATGPVVVQGAVLYRERSSQDIIILRGTVQAAELSAPGAAGAPARAVPGVTVQRASISADTNSIRIEGSCVAQDRSSAIGMEPRDGCAAADEEAVAGFVTRGTDELPADASLRIDARTTDGDPGEVQLVVTELPQETLIVPTVLLWVATLLPLWTLLVVVVAGFAWWRGRGNFRDVVAKQAVADGIVGDDRERCTNARLAAALGHRAERITGLVATITVAVALAAAMGAVNGEPPWARFGWARVFGDLGLYFAIAVGAGFLWFASKVRTTDDARRQAGVLWDVTTFWPRVAHPLGPPCYAERVVPEVGRRVREALQDGKLVIVSGHSQGSVIAVAVASRLADDQLENLRLVTYGSQLSAWFGRLFPGVLGPDALGTAPIEQAWGFGDPAPDAPAAAGPPAGPAPDGSLRSRLAWVNLFRRTDPIGFRLFSDREAPIGSQPQRGSDIYVTELDDRFDLWTHSSYQFTPQYEQVINAWAPAQPAAAVADEPSG